LGAASSKRFRRNRPTDFKTILFFLIASFPGRTRQAFSGKQLSRCFSSDRDDKIIRRIEAKVQFFLIPYFPYIFHDIILNPE
jgi:hypothetical protein